MAVPEDANPKMDFFFVEKQKYHSQSGRGDPYFRSPKGVGGIPPNRN
jgi:hypothetical protein